MAERRKLNNRLSARRSYQRKRDRSQRLEQDNRELRDALRQVQTLQAVRHRLEHPEAPPTALPPAGQPGALGSSADAAPQQAHAAHSAAAAAAAASAGQRSAEIVRARALTIARAGSAQAEAALAVAQERERKREAKVEPRADQQPAAGAPAAGAGVPDAGVWPSPLDVVHPGAPAGSPRGSHLHLLLYPGAQARQQQQMQMMQMMQVQQMQVAEQSLILGAGAAPGAAPAFAAVPAAAAAAAAGAEPPPFTVRSNKHGHRLCVDCPDVDGEGQPQKRKAARYGYRKHVRGDPGSGKFFCAGCAHQRRDRSELLNLSGSAQQQHVQQLPPPPAAANFSPAFTPPLDSPGDTQPQSGLFSGQPTAQPAGMPAWQPSVSRTGNRFLTDVYYLGPLLAHVDETFWI